MRHVEKYVAEWTTATDNCWSYPGPYDDYMFRQYLHKFCRSTRTKLVKPSSPDEVHNPSTTDMYPIESHADIVHQAVRIMSLGLFTHFLFIFQMHMLH